MKKYALVFIFLSRFSASSCMDTPFFPLDDVEPLKQEVHSNQIPPLFLGPPARPCLPTHRVAPVQMEHLTRHSGPILRQIRHFQEMIDADDCPFVIFGDVPDNPEAHRETDGEPILQKPKMVAQPCKPTPYCEDKPRDSRAYRDELSAKILLMLGKKSWR